MPEVIRMPKLGVNMERATIMEWVVNEGDSVDTGDPILNIETDKATQEVCSPKAGIVARILAREGDTVSIQAPIAVLVEPGEVLTEDFLASIREG
jgi:pyruvate dehydrogenase E2 component (dihydrolipoamide acetyltransferase)